VAWLGTTLGAATTPPAVAREAAQALGKFLPPAVPATGPTPATTAATAAAAEARRSLASYLLKPRSPRRRRPSWAKRCCPSAASPRRMALRQSRDSREPQRRNPLARCVGVVPAARSRRNASHPEAHRDRSGDVRSGPSRGLRRRWWMPPRWTAEATRRSPRARQRRSRSPRSDGSPARHVQYDDENAFGVVVNTWMPATPGLSVSAAEGGMQFRSRPP
jgi:hypothetical protein